jgi:hypothetical protein
MRRFGYQPADSAAASAASLPGRSDLHFVATNLLPVTSSASCEISQMSGGTMMSGSKKFDLT